MTSKILTVTQLASLGGKARAKKLSKKRRSQIAKIAVTAREKKRTAITKE